MFSTNTCSKNVQKFSHFRFGQQKKHNFIRNNNSETKSNNASLRANFFKNKTWSSQVINHVQRGDMTGQIIL